jgi:hypothetical protein
LGRVIDKRGVVAGTNQRDSHAAASPSARRASSSRSKSSKPSRRGRAGHCLPKPSAVQRAKLTQEREGLRQAAKRASLRAESARTRQEMLVAMKEMKELRAELVMTDSRMLVMHVHLYMYTPRHACTV